MEYQGAIYAINKAIGDSRQAFAATNYFVDVCHYRDWINSTMINFRPLFV